MSPWNYPGVYGTGAFVGPSTGPYGRDTGAVAWGQFFAAKRQALGVGSAWSAIQTGIQIQQ